MFRSVLQNIKKLISSNPSFAQSSNDFIAFSIFILGGHVALWFELFNVLPFYSRHYPKYIWFHAVLAVTLYLLTFINLYYLINTPTSPRYLELCAKKKDDWKYCILCQAYAPPRSHHCRVCGTCILKRDHHCWFAGCCVGYQNFRYYYCMVATITIAAIYANLYHAEYIFANLGGFSLGTILCIFLPHVAGFFGFLSLSQFIIALMAFIALLCMIMFTWLFVLQCIHLYNGQTEYERHKNDTDYDLGLRKNLIDGLGKRWYLVMLSPWIRSDLCGDGMWFETREKTK
ncbi:hypothetical protein LSH36_277g03050 [Paralvinella palmiformis]|uniref:Palmitoyltransferase n=1 Tax=Paralvinella palmiformis TaxID=53620 RepID=A0AAD9N4L1_9ANNE|nr:hypothetical protein LSH36_277g03050 [Paralvinella palmiformis]